MKKFLSLFVIAALLLPVLAGCQGTANSAGVPENKTVLSAQADEASAVLTQDAALAIVLADAKLTQEEISELEIELDKDGVNSHYDINFEKDGRDYDYEVNAQTGEVLKREIPQVAPVSTEPETAITKEKALEIALADAGLKQNEIQDLDIELDKDEGTVHYDVDFEKDDKDYDYEIDAQTGEILKKDVPKAPAATTTASSNTSSSTTSSSKNIGRTKARDIALKHAGLKASQVRDLEVELDKEGGKTHYDVDFEYNGYDYDYEIDAVSGKILKSRKEKD